MTNTIKNDTAAAPDWTPRGDTHIRIEALRIAADVTKTAMTEGITLDLGLAESAEKLLAFLKGGS